VEKVEGKREEIKETKENKIDESKIEKPKTKDVPDWLK